MPQEETVKTVRVVISGRVQGVWYRGWTVSEAGRRDLRGWVRNRADGTVEAVFSGPAEAVDEMISACYAGPPAARVDRIDRFEDAAAPSRPGFEQRATL